MTRDHHFHLLSAPSSALLRLIRQANLARWAPQSAGPPVPQPHLQLAPTPHPVKDKVQQICMTSAMHANTLCISPRLAGAYDVTSD